MIRFYKPTTLIVFILIILTGCRKDDVIIPSEEVDFPPQQRANIKGFYLLNEGNMNMNKASLDYCDYATGKYLRNVYGEANPDATLGLGDVGNDMGIYGTKLYTVINASNKLEIMDVETTERLGVIDIKNGRYITFANGKAYVSAYDGEIGMGQNSPNGFVAEIDTASLTITRKVKVGRQPEELAVVDGRLYVANSGGYSPPNYETTVSVVDLNSFEEIGKINVAPNLHRLRASESGDLYVSSRGNHYEIPSNLYVIDTKKGDLGEVRKQFDKPCANLAIVGDTAWIIGSKTSYNSSNKAPEYYMIDTINEKILNNSFVNKDIADKIKLPYGIAVDPESKDVYLTDALDYVSPGTLYCIDKNGTVKFEVKTGDIPAHFAFVYKTTTIEK